MKIDRADKINTADFKNKKIILLSNHVSYLDIFLLVSIYKTLYVSKIEVLYYPLIGQIAWLIGIIFLKRSSPAERHGLIYTIAHKPFKNILTIFPQGTTSSIENSLPFKCGIFKTADINHDIVLLPVTIHYKEDSEIAWTREQILFDNVKKVCAIPGIHVKVTIHSPVTFADLHEMTISEICYATQEKVLSGLREKY